MSKIEEAYIKTGSFLAISTMWLKMNNRRSIELQLKLGGSSMLGASMGADLSTGIALRMKIINDKWVNAINKQILELKNKNCIKINKCSTCGKNRVQENILFCPYCGKAE